VIVVIADWTSSILDSNGGNHSKHCLRAFLMNRGTKIERFDPFLLEFLHPTLILQLQLTPFYHGMHWQYFRGIFNRNAHPESYIL
jgi:hypothetical protein